MRSRLLEALHLLLKHLELGFGLVLVALLSARTTALRRCVPVAARRVGHAKPQSAGRQLVWEVGGGLGGLRDLKALVHGAQSLSLSAV